MVSPDRHDLDVSGLITKGEVKTKRMKEVTSMFKGGWESSRRTSIETQEMALKGGKRDQCVDSSDLSKL